MRPTQTSTPVARPTPSPLLSLASGTARAGSAPVRRRRFLAVIGSGVAASGFIASIAPPRVVAASTGSLIAGTIEAVDAARSLLVLGTPTGSKTVLVPRSATVERSGRVALTDVRVGEHVVVELASASAPYVATLVTLLYHRFDGQVVDRTASLLRLTTGVVNLLPATVVRSAKDPTVVLPATSPVPGDEVIVLAAHDHRRASRTAHTIFVIGSS